jgi:hypothetical protein
MLRFTCYKGIFSTFVFASQNRSFTLMASPPLRGPPGGSRKNLVPEGKNPQIMVILKIMVVRADLLICPPVHFQKKNDFIRTKIEKTR